MLKLVVLSCLVAAVCAGGALIAPYAAPYAYASPYYNPYAAAPLAYASPYGYPYAFNNYRGPLSLAPGQPANILGADGRPLDTLDVNLDKSAHLTAKAFGGHILKKRSIAAPLLTSYSTLHSAPLAYSSYATPLTYSAHYTSPIASYPYSSYPYTTLAHTALYK